MTRPTVMVVGASGMLASRIASNLIEDPDTRLRLMVRSGSDGSDGRARLANVVARAAEIVEADLSDAKEPNGAMQEVDVIVSSVQDGRDVIVDGQLTLLAAATRNGVGRMVPSDFALDLFKSPPGEHASFDKRREADEAIAASAIEPVYVLNGAFMGTFLHAQFAGVFDMEKGAAVYWGDGDDPFDATSVEDTARYTARAATDRNLPSGKLAVAGEQRTFNRIIDAVEHVSGRHFERRRHGTVAELESTIVGQRAADPISMAAIASTCILYMLNGRSALTDLPNDRYLNVRPESYLQNVELTWEQVA